MSKRFEDAKRMTEKYRSRLIPCSYCGSTDIRVTSEREIFGIDGKPARYYWGVSCPTRDCDCATDFSIHKAIKKWNFQQMRRKEKSNV